MERTSEKLLTWAPLGVGLALILSGHKRLGFMLALVSPATAITQHPRGTRRALKLMPRVIAKAGRQFSCTVARGTKKRGKSLGWLVG